MENVLALHVMVTSAVVVRNNMIDGSSAMKNAPAPHKPCHEVVGICDLVAKWLNLFMSIQLSIFQLELNSTEANLSKFNSTSFNEINSNAKDACFQHGLQHHKFNFCQVFSTASNSIQLQSLTLNSTFSTSKRFLQIKPFCDQIMNSHCLHASEVPVRVGVAMFNDSPGGALQPE